ncbi:MAG: M15 family metallopeptidase [Clostridia bacterium]|nr:M15 family metallopeptidase [Clostridia bacterium]
MREGFVYLDEAVPGIYWDAKYHTSDNFTGSKVDGYEVNRIVGTSQLARGLALASRIAREKGLALFLWDGYRPLRAVRRFVKWAGEPENGRTKAAHYPNIDKADIIPLGYVSERSAHSRGSAVDLTLCIKDTKALLDMGGIFDLMDASSHHAASGISEQAARNRRLLKEIMEDSGFNPYNNEWWHYSLIDEPWPDDYFDFPIE